MYGTVARFRVRPGTEEELLRIARESVDAGMPGYVSESIHRLDSDPSTWIMAVVFDSREAYRANAERPETHAHYLRLRALLEDDPVWEDEEVVFTAPAGQPQA